MGMSWARSRALGQAHPEHPRPFSMAQSLACCAGPLGWRTPFRGGQVCLHPLAHLSTHTISSSTHSQVSTQPCAHSVAHIHTPKCSQEHTHISTHTFLLGEEPFVCLFVHMCPQVLKSGTHTHTRTPRIVGFLILLLTLTDTHTFTRSHSGIDTDERTHNCGYHKHVHTCNYMCNYTQSPPPFSLLAASIIILSK